MLKCTLWYYFVRAIYNLVDKPKSWREPFTHYAVVAFLQIEDHSFSIGYKYYAFMSVLHEMVANHCRICQSRSCYKLPNFNIEKAIKKLTIQNVKLSHVHLNKDFELGCNPSIREKHKK